MSGTAYWQARIIAAVEDKSQTRYTLGILYGVLMHFQRVEGTRADWGVVNRAILTRYTMAGLTKIKKNGWGMAGKPIPEFVLVEEAIRILDDAEETSADAPVEESR